MIKISIVIEFFFLSHVFFFFFKRNTIESIFYFYIYFPVLLFFLMFYCSYYYFFLFIFSLRFQTHLSGNFTQNERLHIHLYMMYKTQRVQKTIRFDRIKWKRRKFVFLHDPPPCTSMCVRYFNVRDSTSL